MIRRARRLAVWLMTVAIVPAGSSLAAAQSFAVRVTGDMLQVRGSGLRLLEGPVLDHLKDGRSVRVLIGVAILDAPKGTAMAQAQQTFVLSFDLWEQRFAATRTGAASRSISHLTAADAEAWCLDNVTVPLASIRRARGAAIWIRVDYHIEDRAPEAHGDDSAFTLRALIDVLSRRRQDEAAARSWEAGPFRLDK